MNIAYLEIVKKVYWSFSKHLFAESLRQENYDYLFLGNSLIMDAVDTKLLEDNGYPAFNLGIGGASIKSNQLQLESYLRNGNKVPATVVLGLGKFLNNDQLSNSIHPVVRYTEEPYWKVLLSVPLLKYRWMATEILKKIVSSNHRNAVIVNGQLRISKTVADKSKYSDEVENELIQEEYYKQKTLIEFAKMCQSNGIRLIIVEMPSAKKYQNEIDIGPYEFKDKQFNFAFYNFNNRKLCEMFSSQKDWLGNSHLNKYGAVKFTQFLIDSNILD